MRMIIEDRTINYLKNILLSNTAVKYKKAYLTLEGNRRWPTERDLKTTQKDPHSRRFQRKLIQREKAMP